ncbi:MAG: hypothetical protein FJY97_09805 [candidate division Zixibacteria bacterium]|nr:hypothetical protein [candidate division Zixibacteria bacterium]
MNANDVIESYVADVAALLPRKQRNDVAFELRALLNEELQAKAETDGRGVDAARAIELLHAFGRPADVAARYRPTLTVIDPADGYRFLQATIIGMAIIWGVGLLMPLWQPIDSAGDFLRALGQWWGTTVIPSLWWPGLLVVGFGVAAWTRRRWPQTSEWKPRAHNQSAGSPVARAMGLVGIVFGVYILVDPHWLLDVFWGGRAAPSAYEALTYTDRVLHRQAPFLLALILLNIPLFIAIIVTGRRSVLVQRSETVLSLAMCAAIVWTVLDGPILMAPASEQTAKFFLVLIVVFTLIDVGIKLYRSVKPAPNLPIEA